MPHTHIDLSETGIQGRPHDDHEHLKIHRLHESLPTDKPHYLLAALGEITAGVPVPAHYPGPALAYIIEGEVHFTDDSKPGEVTKVIAGDVIHIEQDSHITFSSPNKAKMFGVTYAPSHMHPEDFVKK